MSVDEVNCIKTNCIEINRKQVMDQFADYVSNYDASDEKIKLKIEHTYRVASLCQRIAQSIGLDRQDVDLAWLMGMLHDIGRFEQLRQYGTFSDADSIDHAHYGVKILFEDHEIEHYITAHAGDEMYELTRTAIWNHSAYRVQEGIPERAKMFCDILRDADKVDILKVNHDVPMEVIYNVTTEELKHASVTDEVMQQFQEHHAILRSVKKTCVDNIVGHAALVFELVYPESMRAVQEQGYLEKLLAFQSENEKTQQQFAVLRKCMEEYLKAENIACLSVGAIL